MATERLNERLPVVGSYQTKSDSNGGWVAEQEGGLCPVQTLAGILKRNVKTHWVRRH